MLGVSLFQGNPFLGAGNRKGGVPDAYLRVGSRRGCGQRARKSTPFKSLDPHPKCHTFTDLCQEPWTERRSAHADGGQPEKCWLQVVRKAWLGATLPRINQPAKLLGAVCPSKCLRLPAEMGHPLFFHQRLVNLGCDRYVSKGWFLFGFPFR